MLLGVQPCVVGRDVTITVEAVSLRQESVEVKRRRSHKLRLEVVNLRDDCSSVFEPGYFLFLVEKHGIKSINLGLETLNGCEVPFASVRTDAEPFVFHL